MQQRFDELSLNEQEHFIAVCIRHGWIQADFIVISEVLVSPDTNDESDERQIIVEAKANGSRANYAYSDEGSIEEFERELLAGRFGDAPDTAGG